MKLIDKDALVAEIDRRIKGLKDCHADTVEGYAGEIAGLKRLLSFLDTFEVKEVDLEKEIEKVKKMYRCLKLKEETIIDFCAKHFIELGLKANQENNVIGIIEREVKIDAGGYPYIDCDIEFYDYDKDIPLAKEGDKVKIIVIKEELEGMYKER